MADAEDYMLMSSDMFGKDHLLSNFLQDPLSPVAETNFPSPASSTDSVDSPETHPQQQPPQLSIDPSMLQSLPLSVLQSLAAMYEQPPAENFDQFVKFEEEAQKNQPAAETTLLSCSETTGASTKAKGKSYRPPRQLECFNCHVTKTPLWRRTPDRAHSLCNACGLYYKQYGSHRPLHVRQKQPTPTQKEEPSSCTQCEQTKPVQKVNDLWLCDTCQPPSTSFAGEKRRRSSSLLSDSRPTTKLHIETPTPQPPHPLAQSKEWAEIDDSRFKTLLSRMNTQQMYSFLGMLERRCAILRSILIPQE
ncbi:GATA zinc finger-domain-containing protein [Sporodiniella umbellata]|nr:GATA zinc finger-domain-containing protein [Sporodiniella umbellata]